MNIQRYANKLIKEAGRMKRWHKVVSALACVVVFCTTYMLIMPAVTMERETFCGYTDHTHSDSCYSQVLTCGLEETQGHVHTEECYKTEKVLTCALEEGEDHAHTDECYETSQKLICGMEEGEGAHTHSDDCYEQQLTCGLEEHTHTLACYSNPYADVEEASDWEQTMASVTLTADLRANVAAIAQSQVDYKESTKNYEVMEDGETIKGYTCYGAWYGDPYADWDGMFVDFCLHYAGVSSDDMPAQDNCADWIEFLDKHDLYVSTDSYEPQIGDLVYIDDEPDDDESPVRLALISEVKYDKDNALVSIKTVEGNPETGKVEKGTYQAGDKHLFAYGILNIENTAEAETETTDTVSEAEKEQEDEDIVVGTLTAEGKDYKITVDYTSEAGFPEDVELVVNEITKKKELNNYIEQSENLLDLDISQKQTDARFFDITFKDGDGNEITPEAGVKVNISVSQEENPTNISDVQVVHFGEEAETVDCTKEEGDDLNVTFDAESFSVYGVVYTVDFEYEVDGKVYQFNMPGGGFVSFTDLVDLLGMLDDTNFEDTADFVAQVEQVEFSNPELLSVSKVEETTTVGAIKDSLGLACVYSTELTEAQIAEINAQTVETGDWALISVEPFTSEESLTVTMKNGNQFVVEMTDAQITKDVLTADGETYTITIEYEDEANIPEDADLKVREINAGSEEYAKYLKDSAQRVGLTTDEISFARFFDIEIIDANGEKIEPEAHVQVKISYRDAVKIEEEESLNVIHFGEENTEVISQVDVSEDNTEINYEQGSFSVTGTIVTNPSANNKYMLLVKQGDDYYIINNDGTLTEVEYENDEVSVDDPMLWTYQDNHLYFNSQASSFSSRKIAVDFYYRYLNPNAASGLAEDNVGEGSSVQTHREYIQAILEEGDRIVWRELMASTGVQYTGGKLKSSTSDHYIGVVDDNGTLRVTGQKSQSDAAEIIFARASKVESNIGPAYHTVDHIDISITGASRVSMPLDPGTYYYKDGSGRLQSFTLEDGKIIDLEKDNVSVTTDDMKRARITAYTKDNSGNKTMLDDVYFITGYSANKKTNDGHSPDQVRIEGSFKVANIAPVSQDQRHSDGVRNSRLDNKIFYNVSATKPVEFDLKDTEHGQLYDTNGNPLKVTVDVALSADFDYWDKDNTCPGITFAPGFVNNWEKGDIYDNGWWGSPDTGGTLSGMDFEIKGTFKSTMISVIKVDQDNNAPLSGAYFTMTQVKADGTPVEGGYEKGPLPVDARGKLTFTGLTTGRYLLEESVVPAGYTSPQQQWYIIVDENGDTSLDNVTVEHSLISESDDNVYTVKNKKGSQQEPEGPESNVENHKRIDALRDKVANPDTTHSGDLTDLYRLYLDYKINTVQEENGVDLLFVLDHSGSMNNNAWSGNVHRAPSVRNALNGENGVIAEFLEMSDKNQWAAVEFAGPNGMYYGIPTFRSYEAGNYDSKLIAGWSRNRANISLENQGANMLTDYIAGFWRAEQLLTGDSVKNDGRKKVIVFISDGIPTLHIPGLNGSLSGAGTATGSDYYPDWAGGCPDETLTEFGYFVNDMRNAGYTFGENMELYTIGFGSAINDSSGIGNALLKNMLASAYGDQNHIGNFMTLNDINGYAAYNDTAANTLKDYLRTITGLKEKFDNIVIKDDLSKYVDLYGLDAGTEQTAEQILTAAGAKVTMTNPSDPTKAITLYENGSVSTAEAAKFTDSDGTKKPILQSVSYDKSTKTVKATFNPAYKAEPGITYTLSFDVKTTEAAYTEHAQTGYTKDGDGNVTTGDADTDFTGTNPDNSTSSGKEGFHSNDSAQVSYKHNDVEEHKDYPHPVIQVFEAPIQLLKTDQTGKALIGAKFDLYKDAYDASGTEAAATANDKNRIKTGLTSAMKGKAPNQVAEIAIEKLKPGTYYLVEKEAPAGYILIDPIKIVVTVSTTVENGTTTDTVSLVATQGNQEMTNFLTKPDAETNTWVLKIQNNAGAALPNTGGPGTQLFTILGSILILGAGVLLWRRRRLI